jgi:hypothetical protein
MKKYYTISPIFNEGGIGSGFFSNYRIVLEKLIQFENQKNNGEYEDTVPYITWANTTFVDGFDPVIDYGNIVGGNMPINDEVNPFDYWFDQEIPYQLNVLPENIIKSPLNRNNFIDHREHYFNNVPFLNVQQLIDKKYITPKQYILDKVNDIYEKEFKNEIVLGIMARGSEFNFWHNPEYGYVTIDDYLKNIENILNKHPEITKLFIVSDETEYVEKISNKFPNSYFIPGVFRRTDETDEYLQRVPCWMNVSKKRENHCRLLGEEAIIQTKLLAKSNYLFGRLSGLICGAVLWNENIKEVFKI